MPQLGHQLVIMMLIRRHLVHNMKLIDHVKGTSKFQRYCGGYLYYVTDTGIEFTVPVVDIDSGSVRDEEKTMTLMRWLRQHIDWVNENNKTTK